MKKKLIIILILICVVSFIKTFYILINDKNIRFEKYGCVKGKIVNIIRYDNKIVYDIKSNYKYRVTSYSEFKYNLGDIVNVCGDIKVAKNNTVRNLFNYRKYLLSLNIRYIVQQEKVSLVSKNKNILYKIKNNFIRHIDKYKSNNYLKTFIIADQSMIEKDYKDMYKNLGISHLFSVSGMHVNFFLLLINKIIKDKKNKIRVTFIFLMFMIFITNYTVSLLRCVLFIIICFLNKKYDLNYKKKYLLILTFFILLIFNSYLIYNIGFIFSFMISFFILNIENNKNLFYISLISFLSSLPILALFYFKINLLSFIYNIIYVPIVTLIIFPFSILTFIFPILDIPFLNLINIFNFTIKVLEKVKIFSFALAKPSIFLFIFYYVTLYIFMNKDKKYIMFYILMFIINLNSKFLIINPEITYLDVGQGDCNIIILPRGKTILIDTGGLYNSNYSLSKNNIIPYLNSKGISKIDLLVLSHGDYDHMGEAINLVENFKVEKVIFNCGPYNDLEQELIEVLDKKKIPYYSCIKELNIDDNKLYFLNNKDYNNENDNSSVIYTELNNYKFLFMGDAGTEVEEDLIQKYNIKDIDVLKAGHHGSKTSSSKEFIDNINPKYSIISVGKNNRYGHPDDNVLENLESSKIYRTDQDGSIMFKINKDKLKIETYTP